jgi:hypothetical protein
LFEVLVTTTLKGCLTFPDISCQAATDKLLS